MARETVGRFHEALFNVVEYFKHEYDLSNAEALGVIEMLKLDLYLNMQAEDPEERSEG